MIQNTQPSLKLPYGIDDLNPSVEYYATKPARVRCYVRDCDQLLEVPTRQQRGQVCPRHGIRCHYSGGKPTYAYAEATENLIVARELFRQQVVGSPFKFESHRFGLERSEDALTWNVFRSLQDAGHLHHIARRITGDDCGHEPLLYLWGLCLSEDDFEPWHLLIKARERFESNLPVERPLTEPDIALFLPGRYLILIEAKFTSSNTCYERGPRRSTSSLTLDELRDIYHDPTTQLLDRRAASMADRIYYQLWRNMVFAEWMAREDHSKTQAFHVNLVRQGQDEASAEEFSRLVNLNFKDRFQQRTWEGLYREMKTLADLTQLRRYLETKTSGLRPAFRLR